MTRFSRPLFACIILLFGAGLVGNIAWGQVQTTDGVSSELRRSPVSFHISFDQDRFYEEDFLEQSGRKSVTERKIDFPEGKFGKSVRMSFIPDPPDANNMSSIDLGLIRAVISNSSPGNTMGYNQPFIWGSGRISPRLGAVSFWARGEPSFAGPLFEQTSIAFGRTERDLIGIIIGEDNRLGAYLVDARYERHELDTDVSWDDGRWNHIVMNWDWANGLELWLNGQKIASSWGSDGWFDTVPPGLFHLPAPGLMYDEVYLMDRPLSGSEIENLMVSNTPPQNESPLYMREVYDTERLDQYSGAGWNEHLPTVSPERALSVQEVWPADVGDGHVPGWNVIDGRKEMAWPHPYALFTIIPGDADFHAEKVDLQTSPGAKVNYVTLTGNLKNVSMQAGSGEMNDPENLFRVPPGNGFSYGSTITTMTGPTFRIPFTEAYGTPPDFKGHVNLPLSGDKRIQNVGLYYVRPVSAEDFRPGGEKRTLSMGAAALDGRTQFAMHSVTARDERRMAVASTDGSGGGAGETVDIGAFGRLNILAEPAVQETGVSEITLSLPIRTTRAEETLFIRMRDPAIPQRLWNEFTVKLTGFNEGYRRLLLTLDFQDLVLAEGDRLWMDLGTSGSTEVRIGGRQDPAAVFVQNVESYRAVDAYAEKEMIPARAQYAKGYERMPWSFTGREVTIENPYAYGGPFDMLMPAQAVRRVKPDHFSAEFMVRMSDFKRGRYRDDGYPVEPEETELVTLPNPHGAPEWALYMRDYNSKINALIDWWSDRQNPDGQIGGGWNDDTLFLRGLAGYALDGNDKVRKLLDAVFLGLEHTHLFKDGYCNIYPIDRMHTGDFISERYTTVVNNLGLPHAAEREMESAWHLGKPDQTPRYWADAFKSSANVLNWYWGSDAPLDPYISKPLSELTEEFRSFTSVFDEYSFYRMTEANVHRDDHRPYGSSNWGSDNNMFTYMLGGARGARVDAHVSHAVSWPSGGGPDVSRVVLGADDKSLEAVVYSFDESLRMLDMRLDRIEDGRYKVGLYADPEGTG
ncbi:MAG: hypothetical protein WD317_07520, partial [Balneolaceae bacterium]